MISWIRIARGIGDDPKVHALAEQLDLDVATVVGHLVFVFSEMAEHAKSGDLRGVPDTSLERWAGWTGKRGKFAPAFRALFTMEGVVSAWEKHNGAAIQKADADAERLRDRRRNAARASRDASGDSSATRRATDARAPMVRNETVRNEELKSSNGTHPNTHVHPSTHAADAPAAGDGFGAAWAIYPARSGSNPQRDAARAYRARRGEGHTPEVLLAGVERYAAWCEAEGKTGTQWVMQAATFFGPAARFLEAWTITAHAGAPMGGVLPGPENGWFGPTLDRLTDPTRP